MARREYTSGRPTTLSAAFDIGAGSFTIADDGSAATWPTSADFDFFVTIDAGTAQEERVLCSGRASRVVTVAASGRGADGTTESNHLAGATVWPSWSATDANEANVHVESTGYASYSKSVHGLGSGDGVVVGTTKEQTLTLKTLTSPKINENVALTPTSTELNYVDGVTSAIQTQLDAKAPLASPTFTGTVVLPALGNGLAPVGSIIMFAGAAANLPTGYLVCNGDAVSRSTYSVLFGLLSTDYGVGNGSTTFNLPDLRGRAPIGVGTGTGLTARALAATTGTETHTLITAEIPSHNHTSLQFGPNAGAAGLRADAVVTTDTTTGSTGGGGAHNNMQPSIAINFIIKT